MNKSKKIYILLGILAMFCIATYAISAHEEKKEKIKNSDEIILTLDSDSVTSLSWEYEDTALAFHKDEKWLYDEDEAFPVDEDKIDGLLEQFQSFGVSFAIEEVEDYSQYGLDDPTCTIHITADEQEYEIQLGAYSTMDSQRYVSIGDGKVYLVQHDPLEDYDVELSDLIKDDEIPDLSDTSSILFAGSESYEVTYEEESANTYCADDVYFTDNKPLDTGNVNSYLRTVSYLNLSEYVSYNVTDEELKEFGLDTPELTITVNYLVQDESEDKEDKEDMEKTQETFVLHIGRNQEELKAANEKAESEEAEEDEEDRTDAEAGEAEDSEDSVTAYARVGDSQIIYQLTSDEYDDLMAFTYDDLRHKEVLTASFDDIYQIDISLEGAVYAITSEETEEEEKIWHYKDEEELSVSDLQSAIKNLKSDSFTDESPSQKEEISFTVYLNNERYPEIQVELYRYDGNDCLAVLNGETISLVPRSSVVDLIEAVHAIVLN